MADAIAASVISMQKATDLLTMPGLDVTVADASLPGSGRTRNDALASIHPHKAPSVFVARSVVSKVRYAYG